MDDQPDHFLDHCRRSDPTVQAHSFVPRRHYGAYLDALLGAAEGRHASGARLERLVGQVVDVSPPNSPTRAQLATELKAALQASGE